MLLYVIILIKIKFLSIIFVFLFKKNCLEIGKKVHAQKVSKSKTSCTKFDVRIIAILNFRHIVTSAWIYRKCCSIFVRAFFHWSFTNIALPSRLLHSSLELHSGCTRMCPAGLVDWIT